MDGSPSKRLLTETSLESRSVVDGSTRNDGYDPLLDQQRASIIDAVSESPTSSGHSSEIGQREFVKVSSGSFCGLQS